MDGTAITIGDRRSTRGWLAWLATGAAAVALVVVGMVGVGSGGHDDSHITYFVADAVARGWGFVNYDGDPIEQSSSLGFVVLLALLHLVTRVPVPVLAYVVGLVAGAAAVLQAHRLAERLAPGTGPFAAWMTATSFGLVYWSTSGMETALAAALAPTLVLAIGDLVGDEARDARRMSRVRLAVLVVVALAFTSVRPEYTVVSLGVALVLLVLGLCLAVDRRRTFIAAGVMTASAAVLVGFRVLVFGATVPNPVSAKMGSFDLEHGALYLYMFSRESNLALTIAGAAGAVLGLLVLLSSARRGQPRALSVAVTAALVFALLAFPVAVGGDWMEHGRFLVPAIAMLAASTATLARLVSSARQRLVHVALAAIAIYGAVAGKRQVVSEYRRSVGLVQAQRLNAALAGGGAQAFSAVEIANEAHLRDAPLVLALLQILEDLGPTPESPIMIASGQAGMVLYYAALHHYGRIRFIDMYSLTTSEVSRCYPEAIKRRSPLGILLGYPEVLRAGELERRCGMARPDIVFNSSLPTRSLQLKENGYVIVYRQGGWAFGDTALRGFIAVRQELADRAGLEHRYFRW